MELSQNDQLCCAQTTFPCLESAENWTQFLLQNSWVICVHLIPSVQSYYVWEGSVECSKEVIWSGKIFEKNLSMIWSSLCEQHPYTLPQWIYWHIDASEDYLTWAKSNHIFQNINNEN
jgi:periplasmic divalent cation tolerance protein